MALSAIPTLPAPGRILGLVVQGYEVYYDPDTNQLAHAVSVWRRPRIIVGSSFFYLGRRERYAILLHEAAHLALHHMAWRLVTLPLCWTAWGSALARRQELEADAFAAQRGYGADLLRVIERAPSATGPYYPPLEDRRRALLARTGESAHAVA